MNFRIKTVMPENHFKCQKKTMGSLILAYKRQRKTYWILPDSLINFAIGARKPKKEKNGCF